jgi:glycosyltransferase involved in cell wall biosynthesis
MNVIDKIKTKKFIIALHESIPTGPGHDMCDYLLLSRAKKVLFITHPLLNEKEYYATSSSIKMYENGKLSEAIKAFHFVLPMVLLYTKDFFYTLWWVLKSSKKYDLFIGLDPLNAFSAVMLKKMGIVKKTVYYTIDYIPNRYENPVINYLYHFLDKYCVGNCDETWNLTAVVSEAREGHNDMDRNKYTKQNVLPIGVWFFNVKRVSLSKVNKNKLIYVGGLRHIMGVELLIKAMPKLLQKNKALRLHIVGGGADEKMLKNLAKKLGVSNAIIFHGWIRDREQVREAIKDGVIGLAPFAMDAHSFDEVKNADPSKIKEYLVMGMPVIVTKAISNYKQLQDAECGIAINYSVKELIEAIEGLLGDNRKYATYRENALSYVKQYDYNILFKQALERILN